MSNPTNTYQTELGLQQPSASDLTDGTTGSGAVVLANSPALTGTPTAPTQAPGDNTTKLATDAFVQAAITASGSTGGVNAQTVNYLAVSGDFGKLISMNGTTLTLTLPASPPSATWWIAIENINASNLTVSRNGLTIDGAASNLTLTQNQGILVYTDGSNYFTERGMSAGSSITLETNGVLNGSQTLLNLIQGSNVTITDGGSGGVTIAASTGSANAGGTNNKTTNYTQVAGDSGKLISMNGSNLTLTLNATPTSTEWISVENTNSTLLTISRNGLNIDGAASNLTLTQNQGVLLFSDGVNWFTCRGIGGTDTIQVQGTAVTTPFNFSALINGIGPLGEVLVNSFPCINAAPCMTRPNIFYATAQRVVGTVYQNTTGRPILVQASMASSAASVVWTAASDTSSSPTTAVAVVTGSAGTALANDVFITFFVMPGNYYKISASTGTTTLFNWNEYTLTTGTFTDSGDLSGSKALSTVYQNTTTGVKFIEVQIATVTATNSVQGLSDTSPTPTNVIIDTNQSSGGTGTVTMFMLVPAGHYYKVTAASGTISIWHEYSWSVPAVKTTDMSLTTGEGQRRTTQGAATTFVTGTTAAATNLPRIWINNTNAVRWVQVNTSNTTVQSYFAASAADNMPPFTGASPMIAWRPNGASLPRTLFFPVMPGEAYMVFDAISGTITQNHWFEYKLG